jgi:thiamine biosynthesis protein ThiI
MTHSAAVSSSIELEAPELVLVRFGELALKKGNRGVFERALVSNIRAATRPIAPVRVERRGGRIVVFPERRGDEIARRLQTVFGIKSVSPAWGAPTEADAIVSVAKALFEDALADCKQRPVSFRVRTRRAEKRFPMTSTELDRYVAERILPGPEDVTVQMKAPELELGIDLRSERTYLFLKRLPGPGGLPVGTLGRALCLLSGGIDSPVAAWMAMKRGCQVGFVTYHSAPFIGEASKKKVRDLVRVLSRYQYSGRLYVAPFAAIQVAIRDTAPSSYRTVLYRRMMQRIATRLASQYEYQALVTGECLGQVASQTLENITCIAAATELPILRPLLSFDKEEIIAIGRRIGTFEISNIQEPDCCVVFQPKRPIIRGTVDACLEAESKLDVEALVDEAVQGVEVEDLEA